MADEGSEGRASSMDLNLYLGLPRSPRPRSLDLGSDLALSSLPLSESSNSEEIRAPEAAPVVMEGPAPNDEYSPFHTTVPESEVLLAGFRPSSDVDPNHEYTPCFSSYEPFGHSYAQDTEGPVLPYSPSNAPAVSVEDEIALIEERDGGFSAPFNDGAPINLIDDPFVEGSGSHRPYSPNYLPRSSSLQEDETLASYTSMPQHMPGDSSSRGDGTSLQHELLQSPEFRIRRLVESQRWRMRRFRSSVTFGNERPAFFQQVSSTPIDLMQDMVSSPRPSDTYGKHKVLVEGAAAESSEEDIEMKNRGVANFECNICFDIAKEPVVTSCGHLFCWSCLYQWLHVHSDHKECPVCKGEVTEANIFPIYGRGKSGSDKESKDGETSELGVKIPPRPRGNRLESWRQHLRPISRRFGEGITHSLRRLLNHQIRNRTRFGGHEDSISQELLNGGSHVVLTRSMARRLQREEVITGSVPSMEEIRFPRDGSSVPRNSDAGFIFQDGNDLLQQLYGFPSTDRLTAITADIGRAVGRFSSSSNRYGPSTSSANAPISDQFSIRRNVGATAVADQASASSTVAIIQGESSARAASTEPHNAGSSRSYRRRGRSNTAGSSDVDGGTLHARKRRRLN